MSNPWIERWRRHPGSGGKRLTREKQGLAAVIRSLEQPFEAEDVIREVSPQYRTLRDLVDAGLIRRLGRFSGQESFIRMFLADS